MHEVDIKIFCIAQTRLNEKGTRDWLDHIGATETPVPRVSNVTKCECGGEILFSVEDGHHCHSCHKSHESIKPEVTDAGAVCGLCAKRCYMSFEPGLNPNVTRVRKVWHEYLGNILKSGHGSVTEHATWTFAIEGVSRVFTGELNRHRAGVAISEGSMRYIRFDDIGFWMPRSLDVDSQLLMSTSKCKTCKGKGDLPWGEPPEASYEECADCSGTGRINNFTDLEFEQKKEETREQFRTSFQDMEENYNHLCQIWEIVLWDDENQTWVNNPKFPFSLKKKLTSLFRRLIGMGVATGGTWTFNTRALRHIAAMRTSPHAEEEIAYGIGLIGKYIVESEPSLFGDFKLDEATGAWIPKHEKI